MIPARLIRSVPAVTKPIVEHYWARAAELHPGWEMVTYRDPLDPADFPLTAPVWPLATSGAQLAGLVRLEALWAAGGTWLDSDIELYRSLEPLRQCRAFACWEDDVTVPDAVLGAEPGHPAIGECIALAVERIQSSSFDWRTGNGAWSTGPGVTTTVLTGRSDVLLLPPASFFSVHYSAKDQLAMHEPAPYEFGLHHWHGSWLTP